jgi:hypothetical protein
MPKGKGTYGSIVGRPPKKLKKYQIGGKIEDVLEAAQMGGELESIPLESVEPDIPMSNAMERSENYQLGGQVRPPTAPSMPQYKKGGKVDVTDVVKDVKERQKNLKWLDKTIKTAKKEGRMHKTNLTAITGELAPEADYLEDQKKKYKEPSKEHIKEKAKKALHAKRRKKGKKK